MSDTVDQEALAILRRLEPALARIEDRMSRIEERLATVNERVTKIEATPHHPRARNPMTNTKAEQQRRPELTPWLMTRAASATAQACPGRAFLSRITDYPIGEAMKDCASAFKRS